MIKILYTYCWITQPTDIKMCDIWLGVFNTVCVFFGLALSSCSLDITDHVQSLIKGKH